jgi:glycosyltransferase involved in cell wall biosynthesis
MHLIAMKLKKDLGIPWIADFRDPWTEIDYYNDLHLTRRADRKHHRLELEVLTQADKVVTVAPDGARRLGRIGNRNVRTIYNGFDRDDDVQTPVSLPDTFTITYLGVLSKIQNPNNLWQAMAELIKEDSGFDKNLKINMIGQIDSAVVSSINENGLTQHVAYSPYMPHDQVSAVHRSSTLLLLLLMPDSEPRARGLLTGKLFEYMASGRAILCIGPEDGDAARILKETQAGLTVRFEDRERMKGTVKNLYQQYLGHTLSCHANNSIEQYSRKAQTKGYVKILNQLL